MIIIEKVSIVKQLRQILFQLIPYVHKLQQFYLIFYQTLNFFFKSLLSKNNIICPLFQCANLYKSPNKLKTQTDESVFKGACMLLITSNQQNIRQIQITGINIIMLDPQRKLNTFYTRANYQLREIEHSCREVTTMSKVLNTLNEQISSSQVNCKKIEFFKCEIKDKLKELASSVDEVYKILDKKIQLIIMESKKQSNKGEKSMEGSVCNKWDSQSKRRQESEKYSNPQADRLFSDTLNPRITYLQAKVNQLQANQVKLKNKIAQLNSKNQALLEEFNRLSIASNQKISQLTSKISKDSSRVEMDNVHHPPTKFIKDMEHTTLVNNIPKQKKINPLNFEGEQFSYHSNEVSIVLDQAHKKEERQGFLNFGCIPSRSFQKPKKILERSDVSQQCERLDRNDRNRRFDLLLNKLRDSQQQSTDGSHSEQMRPPSQELGSVFSQNIVQRYQI